MRYTDLICFSLILVLFSSIIYGLFSQILRSEKKIEELRKQSDSLVFISESFYNLCRGEGFSSFDEWKRVCGELWELENIEFGFSEEVENPFALEFESYDVYGEKVESLNASEEAPSEHETENESENKTLNE